MKYDHKKIEAKWRKYWQEHPKLYTAEDKSGKTKQYILDMFPYPSGDGLHAGHVESYTATDIISRYLRMKGQNVLHPQGWDAFGLPAENYAIKTKIHPAETTKKAIANFKKQMSMLGFSYDWSREINSSDPEYYKWTQWFFLLFYKNGLAYKAKGKVNWCESCQTVLANEQAEGGKCERCDKPVAQKDLEQWYFKITDFIESSGQTSGLLDGLDKIDWPESTKTAQRNWIGKSEGATVKFPISNFQFPNKSQNSDDQKYLEVFTTRLDTIFGCTFALIAPEHDLVQKLKPQITNWDEVAKYIGQTKKKTDLQRQTEVKEKTGVELNGVKVINPFTKEAISLFVSDFVLAQYGTGAVMAVPAHDERDFAFAKKFKLPVNFVILNETQQSEESEAKGSFADAQDDNKAFINDGVLINSGNYNGLTSVQAREKMAAWLAKEGIGKKVINYKLRDWLVSRQRYWGAPIPIIYCRKCSEISNFQFPISKQILNSKNKKFQTTTINGEEYAIIPVPEDQLPILLPTDVDFMPTGESPLVKSKKFQDVKCPKCGEPARREADTMDTFVCSSWYYFRYADNKNDKEFASGEMLKKWLPVDLYVGGAEHTVLHLLYARFFTKVLHRLGYIDFDEPFLKLRHQGVILAEDGNKMSKSKGNVVNPDEVVKEYGADALRMFEMFMGPLEDAKPWNTKGIVGISRFLERIWKLKSQFPISNFQTNPKSQNSKLKNKEYAILSEAKNLEPLLHKTIKKVGEDIENLKFNTAISALMILVNESNRGGAMAKKQYETFLILLAPFAPHIAEELWHNLGQEKSIFTAKWPEYNQKLVEEKTIQMPVQINGRVRAILTVPADISEDEAKKLSVSDTNIIKWLDGKEPKKVIFVKGRLVNIVI